MPNQSYDFDRLVVSATVPYPEGSDQLHSPYSETFDIQRFVGSIGQFADKNPDIFSSLNGKRDVYEIPSGTGKIEHPSQLTIHIVSLFDQEKLKRCLPHLNGVTLIPNLYCRVAKDWLALRIDHTFNQYEMRNQMKQPVASDANLFYFCRWWFGVRTGDGIEWKSIDFDRVEIDNRGVITREGLTFSPSQWTWPYAAWQLTKEMRAYAILRRLLEEDETHPLTSIIKSGHPYRGLGMQIAAELKLAVSNLDRPR